MCRGAGTLQIRGTGTTNAGIDGFVCVPTLFLRHPSVQQAPKIQEATWIFDGPCVFGRMHASVTENIKKEKL